MTEIITSANDIELVLKSNGTKRGTAQSMGRVVVDDFSITKDDGSELVHGTGLGGIPAGIAEGTIDYGFSFTINGQDVTTFEMIADSQGRGNIFTFTARKTDDEGNIEWEYALSFCKATSEEHTASTGDVMEYSVEGIAAKLDKQGTRESDAAAWNTN